MQQSQSNSISNVQQNIIIHSQDPGGNIGFPSSFVFPGDGVGFFTPTPLLLMCPQLGVTKEEFGQLSAAHALMVMSSGSGLEQDLDLEYLDFWAFHIQQDARRQQLLLSSFSSNVNLTNAIQIPLNKPLEEEKIIAMPSFLLPPTEEPAPLSSAVDDHSQHHHLFDGMDWMLEDGVILAENNNLQEEYDGVERDEGTVNASNCTSSTSSARSSSSSHSTCSSTAAKKMPMMSFSCSSINNDNNNVAMQNVEEEEEEESPDDGSLKDLVQLIMDSLGTTGSPGEAVTDREYEEKAKLGPWRQRYLAQMSSAYSQKRIQPRNMLSRKRYDTLVERLKRTEEMERSAQLPGHIVKISQKYRLVRFNMSDKRNSNNEKPLEMLAEQSKNRLFLCVDQLFDVLYKLHMNTRHGRSISMYSAARKKFANITVESILKFLEGCEDCKKWNKNEKKLNTLLKPNWNKDKKIHYEQFFDFDEHDQLIQCNFCPYKKATAEGQKCTNALRSHLKKHHLDMLRQSRSQLEEEE